MTDTRPVPPEAVTADMVRSRRRTARLKKQVFDYYGWACACCGSLENPSIDHVVGDGKTHRAMVGIGRSATQMYYWLVSNDFPDGFQTLCVPCNKSKGNGARCILDHRAGRNSGMTSAERSRRWHARNKVAYQRGICPACRHSYRLRNNGSVTGHGGCPGAGRLPLADLTQDAL